MEPEQPNPPREIKQLEVTSDVKEKKMEKRAATVAVAEVQVEILV